MPTYTIPLASGPLTVSADEPRRRVVWCSDWARIHELVPCYARTEFGGPYTFGHVDYLLGPGLTPDAEPEAMRLFSPAPTQIPGQTTINL